MLEEIKNARQKVSAEADILIADNHTHTYVWTSVRDAPVHQFSNQPLKFVCTSINTAVQTRK